MHHCIEKSGNFWDANRSNFPASSSFIKSAASVDQGTAYSNSRQWSGSIGTGRMWDFLETGTRKVIAFAFFFPNDAALLNGRRLASRQASRCNRQSVF